MFKKEKINMLNKIIFIELLKIQTYLTLYLINKQQVININLIALCLFTIAKIFAHTKKNNFLYLYTSDLFGFLGVES